jgi:hypothetical protein
VVVWRNVGAGTAADPSAMGHWAMLDLVDDRPNRSAIGSRVEVRIGERTTTIERTVGGGHIGGQLGWIHVGLGAADEASVRVTWPDGEVGPWLAIPADGFSIIERGASSVRPWTPVR